jgi:hypothetical protein
MKGNVARVAKAVFMLAFGTLQAYAGVTVTKYHEVSRVVNGTTVTAAYRVEFHNAGLAIFGVNASVASSAKDAAVVSGTVSVGDIKSNKSVAPSGTITVIRPARPEGAHN